MKELAPMAMAHPILYWIKYTPVAGFVRDSPWAFPALQSLHFIGMALLVGAVGAFDLRVLGVARALPLNSLRRVLPLAFVGFGINLVSGALFFAHDPFAYAFNPSFRLKMLLIAAAGLNALGFRFERAALEPSVASKLIAGLSLALWLAVIAAGRYIAFS
jgi:hypothetical protein